MNLSTFTIIDLSSINLNQLINLRLSGSESIVPSTMVVSDNVTIVNDQLLKASFEISTIVMSLSGTITFNNGDVESFGGVIFDDGITTSSQDNSNIIGSGLNDSILGSILANMMGFELETNVIATTRKVTDLVMLMSGTAADKNGYIIKYGIKYDDAKVGTIDLVGNFAEIWSRLSNDQTFINRIREFARSLTS